MSFGNVLKKLRLQRNFTQTELYKNFTTRKQINRIENDKNLPSFEMLNHFSRILGSEIFDYLPYCDDDNAYEMKNELDILKQNYHSSKYNSILTMIESSKFAFYTNHPIAKLEYSWLYNTSLFNLQRKKEINTEVLYKLLGDDINKNNFHTVFNRTLFSVEHKIILIIIALIDKDQLSEKIQYYQQGINYFESKNNQITDSAYINYCYNTSVNYLSQKDYENCLHYSNKAINNCLQNNTFTLLAPLYNIAGIANYRLGNTDLGKEQQRNHIALIKIFDNDIANKDTVIRKVINNFELDVVDCDFCKKLYSSNN